MHTVNHITKIDFIKQKYTYLYIDEDGIFSLKFFFIPSFIQCTQIKGEIARDSSREDRRPILNTASKIRTKLKMGLKESYGIDIDDDIKYPKLKQRWKAYTEQLAKEGKRYH